MPTPTYPKAYIDYLVYFHGVRDYFECHEVIEEEWMKDPQGRRKPYWRGLIQLAVAFYHWRRENQKGAVRSFENAEANLAGQALGKLALDEEELMRRIHEWRAEAEDGKPYESGMLPVTDEELVKRCEELSMEKGCAFGNPSDLSDEALIHKHSLPNREKVISKREKKKRGLY